MPLPKTGALAHTTASVAETVSPPVPRHVAIIMDGNGRWATARHLPRVAGHRAGAQAVRRTIEAAIRKNVSWLTLYAFSSENWQRPDDEISDLTGLLRHYLRHEVAELHPRGCTPARHRRPRPFRPRDRPRTGRCRGTYGGQHKAQSHRRLVLWRPLGNRRRQPRAVAEAAVAQKLDPAALTETVFSSFLFTAGMPDPDLVIRTSGRAPRIEFPALASGLCRISVSRSAVAGFLRHPFSTAHSPISPRAIGRYGARPES